MKEIFQNLLLNNLKPPCIKEKAYTSLSKFVLYILYAIALPALIFSILLVFDIPNIFLFNSDNRLSQFLNEVLTFTNKNKLGLVIISFVFIALYLLVRKIIFGINIHGQWDNDEYVQYLEKTWIKYFSQEKDKNLIFKALKGSCNDHLVLIQNWNKFYIGEQMGQIYKEHLIKTMFELLECCVEIDNGVAADHIIAKLQNLFDKNKFFITEQIEKDWDNTYIKRNLDLFNKKIYFPCAIHLSYDDNSFFIRFNNRYSKEQDRLPYSKFFDNKDIELIRKLRIVWLIYETEPTSENDILRSIKELPNLDQKILDFINVLLEERKIEKVKTSGIVSDDNPKKDSMP